LDTPRSCSKEGCKFNTAGPLQECEVCLEQVSSSLLRKKFTTFIVPFQAHEQNTCKDCTNQDWVNAEGMCRDCVRPLKQTKWVLLCPDCEKRTPTVCLECKSSVDVTLTNGVCVTCTFSKNWHEYPKDTLRAGECVSCKLYRIRNKEGYCQTCFTEEALKRSTSPFLRSLHTCALCDTFIPSSEDLCNAHRESKRNCADCDQSFIASSSRQWQCDECLPTCAGCKDKFVPEFRGEQICDDCTAYKRKGICTSCKKNADEVPDTETGQCFDCLDEAYVGTPYICSRCKKAPVDAPNEVCEECRNSKFECPSCKRQNLDYSQIVCEECRG
jgi:hypothetical protein